MVRRQRTGLWDAVMYRFGLFPWQCRLCGCRVYVKHRRTREVTGPEPDFRSWIHSETTVGGQELPKA